MTEDLPRSKIFKLGAVVCKHVGCSARKGRVDEHRRVRQAPGIDQTRDVEKQFLRALEREHRDHQVPATRESALALCPAHGAALLYRHPVSSPTTPGPFPQP